MWTRPNLACSTPLLVVVCWAQYMSATFSPVLDYSPATNCQFSCSEARGTSSAPAQISRLGQICPVSVTFVAKICTTYLLVPCNVQAMDPWFLACTTKLNLARAGVLCVLLRVQPIGQHTFRQSTRSIAVCIALMLLTCKAGRQTCQTSAGG